jgi:hypothetical protein
MGQTIPPLIDMCLSCVFYKGTKLIDGSARLEDDHINYCKAFPFGIPHVILSGEHDHRKPYKGDHGIRFEPIKKENQ